MTTLEFKGDWNLPKGKRPQPWATLTADDRPAVEGQPEALLGRIQQAPGETRESVETAGWKFNPGEDCDAA